MSESMTKRVKFRITWVKELRISRWPHSPRLVRPEQNMKTAFLRRAGGRALLIFINNSSLQIVEVTDAHAANALPKQWYLHPTND